MTLFIVQFVLPALLGYTLYVAVSDRLSMSRPSALTARPRWLLSLGFALSVGGAVCSTLLLMEGRSSRASVELLQQAASALAIALAATLAATGAYRVWLSRPNAVETPLPITATAAVRWQEPLQESPPEGLSEAPSDFMSTVKPEAVAETTHRAPPGSSGQPPLLQAADESGKKERAHLEALIENGERGRALAEARAKREAVAHLCAQITIAEQQEELDRVRRDRRRNAEAHGKALSAATRSLEHAKRSARRRRRLQAELDQARSGIVARQRTIVSLVRALDTEKRRTREQLASRARSRARSDRGTSEQRPSPTGAVGNAAGGTTGGAAGSRPGSRLVKKIARARPLIGG